MRLTKTKKQHVYTKACTQKLSLTQGNNFTPWCPSASSICCALRLSSFCLAVKYVPCSFCLWILSFFFCFSRSFRSRSIRACLTSTQLTKQSVQSSIAYCRSVVSLGKLEKLQRKIAGHYVTFPHPLRCDCCKPPSGHTVGDNSDGDPANNQAPLKIQNWPSLSVSRLLPCELNHVSLVKGTVNSCFC